MEPLPSEVSSPLQPLQALGVAVSASLACAEEMVPQRMLRRTLQAETGADAQKGPEHRADMKSLKGFGPDYFFFDSVWGRNVLWFGIALIYGGLIGAFVLTTISGVLNERRKKES